MGCSLPIISQDIFRVQAVNPKELEHRVPGRREWLTANWAEMSLGRWRKGRSGSASMERDVNITGMLVMEKVGGKNGPIVQPGCK